MTRAAIKLTLWTVLRTGIIDGNTRTHGAQGRSLAALAEARPGEHSNNRPQSYGIHSSRRILVAPHPSGINRVRYASVAPEDRKALKDYVKNLQSLPISSYNRAEQKAYWINLYNGMTVELILSRFPVKSIHDINISPGLFARGPWGAKLLTVEEKDFPSTTSSTVSCGRSGKTIGCITRSIAPVWVVQIYSRWRLRVKIPIRCWRGRPGIHQSSSGRCH